MFQNDVLPGFSPTKRPDIPILSRSMSAAIKCPRPGKDWLRAFLDRNKLSMKKANMITTKSATSNPFIKYDGDHVSSLVSTPDISKMATFQGQGGTTSGTLKELTSASPVQSTIENDCGCQTCTILGPAPPPIRQNGVYNQRTNLQQQKDERCPPVNLKAKVVTDADYLQELRRWEKEAENKVKKKSKKKKEDQ